MLGVGGTVVARARAIIEADTRGFEKGVASSERRLKRWQGVATKAALGVGVAFAYGAKKAIDAASNLNEEVSKTGVVFGKASDDVLEWSRKSASGFLMSRRAALQYAGVFGNMLRPMGFTERAAAGMSKRLVELAGDMASFNNANPEDVLIALRAGLSGEIEPLRKFGVFLNQARVEAEAMTSGLVKADVDLTKVKAAQLAVAEATAKHTAAVKEHGPASAEAQKAAILLEVAESKLQKAVAGKVPKLTAAQKAQASYNVILKDTVLQQGDVARTSDSVANRQRRVTAQVEDLQAQLGTGLLPAYAAVLGVMTKVVGWTSRHTTATKILIGVIGGLAGAILAINGALKVARVAMIAFNAVLATNPVILITAAIVALGIALVAAYKKSETFRRVVNGAFQAVREVVADAVGLIVAYVDKYLGAISALARGASKLPLVGDKFKGVADKIDTVRDKLKGLDDTIRGGEKKRVVALTTTITNERTGATSTVVTSAGRAAREAAAKAKAGNGTTGGAAATKATPAAVSAALTSRNPAALTVASGSKTTPAPVEIVRDKTSKTKTSAAAREAAREATRRFFLNDARFNTRPRKTWKRGTGGPAKASEDVRDELTAQALASRQYDFLTNRKSFASSFAPNFFQQKKGADGAVARDFGGGGTTVIVNQTFPAPTPDKHREARYARSAMRAAFE